MHLAISPAEVTQHEQEPAEKRRTEVQHKGLQTQTAP